MVHYTRKRKGGKRNGNEAKKYLNAPIPNSTQASINEKKENAEKVRQNALNRCSTGKCSAANQYLADLSNSNIARMTRKQLNNAIAAKNNIQKKYNAELVSHQTNRNSAAAKLAKYNANLKMTRNNLHRIESNYASAREKANRANLSNAERIKAEAARNNLQRQLNSERQNLNNAYLRGAQLQNNHNKAVKNLENSSQQLVDGYNEHLRIVGEKDDELQRKQDELDTALLRASRANASNAERNSALANVKSLETSVTNLTNQLSDAERIKSEKEEELQKQRELMEEEYTRGQALWSQKQEEISDLESRLASASAAERASIQNALEAATAAAEAAEKNKNEFESKLNGLSETLQETKLENEKKLKEIELLSKNLADEKTAAAAAAASATATFDQLKRQQASNKNASNTEKKQMQQMLENALKESKIKGATLEQIKKEQIATNERVRLLQISLAEATGKKINSLKSKLSIIKKNASNILSL